MKIFIDTNIFLDLILKRDAFKEALLLFNAVEKQFFTGVILDITLLNIDYIAQKQVQKIRDFIRLINAHFTVVGASNAMMEDARAIDNPDLEDNLQYCAAKLSQCDCIITSDQRFYASDLLTLTSREFVDRYIVQ